MRIAPLLVLLVLAGCVAGGAPDRAPSADPPLPAPGILATSDDGRSTYGRYAVIQGSCAPWDGAAIELRLSPSPPTAKGPVAPWIVVSVWQSGEEASGGTFRFPDRTGRVGAAGHCRNEETYEPVESGVVKFDRFADGKPATGTFDLVLKGGRRERGTFSAVWGEMRVPCG